MPDILNDLSDYAETLLRREFDAQELLGQPQRMQDFHNVLKARLAQMIATRDRALSERGLGICSPIDRQVIWRAFEPGLQRMVERSAKGAVQRTATESHSPEAHHAGDDAVPVLPAFEILPGGINFGKATVDLSGKPLACIRELLNAHHHRLDWRTLRDRVWGDDSYAEKATIKNAIADARNSLRKLARLANMPTNERFDPLPCVLFI